MIYIGLFLYTAIMAWVYSSHHKSRKKLSTLTVVDTLLFLFMIIPSVCVAGFRYGISVDYHKVYELIFNSVIDGNSVENVEMGFIAISNILSHIVPETWFLFFSYSAITIMLFFFSFAESRSFFLSVVFFFSTGVFFDTFNGIRQYVVVAFFAYCIRFVRDVDFKKYVIVMGLCSLIHTSALFTIPLFFLYKKKFNNKYVFVLLVFVFIFKNQIVNLLITIMQLFPKYNLYLLRDTLFEQINFSLSGLVMALFGLVPCFMVQKEMCKSDIGIFLYNITFLGFIIALCSSFLPFAERILYYTRCYLIFSIPYACSLMGKRNNILWSIFLSFLMTAMTAIGIYSLDWYAILPYESFF